jgi:hypothetical protein
MHPFSTAVSRFFTAFVCCVLAACAGFPAAKVSSPVSGLIANTYSGTSGPDLSSPLNPDFRYLRVDVSGYPPALLVLGYLEPGPWGPVEVWYSANREVLKIANGRVVGSAGLQADWRNVQFVGLPSQWDWVLDSAFASSNSHITITHDFERVRDAMPGYRFGIREQLRARVAVPPAKVLPILPVPGAVWVEESIQADNLQGLPGSALPSAWFAVGGDGSPGTAKVVASFQCLAASLCMRLQPWSSSPKQPMQVSVP